MAWEVAATRVQWGNAESTGPCLVEEKGVLDNAKLLSQFPHEKRRNLVTSPTTMGYSNLCRSDEGLPVYP